MYQENNAKLKLDIPRMYVMYVVGVCDTCVVVYIDPIMYMYTLYIPLERLDKTTSCSTSCST